MVKSNFNKILIAGFSAIAVSAFAIPTSMGASVADSSAQPVQAQVQTQVEVVQNRVAASSVYAVRPIVAHAQ